MMLAYRGATCALLYAAKDVNFYNPPVSWHIFGRFSYKIIVGYTAVLKNVSFVNGLLKEVVFI